MKKRIARRWIPAIVVLAGLLILAGCGKPVSEQNTAEGDKSTEITASSAADPEEEDADGQNPIMDLVGPYVCDRAMITIEADGREGAKVVVNWGSSAWEESQWTMSGSFDAQEQTIEYHDCVRKDITYDDAGKIRSEEEVYVGGHGFLKFHKDGKLTWQDDQDHAADNMTFLFTPDAG